MYVKINITISQFDIFVGSSLKEKKEMQVFAMNIIITPIKIGFLRPNRVIV